ncbi:MAG: hypothetical protein Q7S40_23610 [Opitutaceae bacterium]|nr:hypothetical protein [Opitutaceae bacterium]
MTGYVHHLLSRARATFTVCCQQRCIVMRPVAISVWNKKTDAGDQN